MKRNSILKLSSSVAFALLFSSLSSTVSAKVLTTQSKLSTTNKISSQITLTANGSTYYIPYYNGRSTQSTSVYDCPWTNSMQIGSIGIENVKIFWSVNNNYYYIEYNVDSGAYGGYKMGYVPKNCINNISGESVPAEEYTPGNTAWLGNNYTVYDRPDANSLKVGTVFSTDSFTILGDAYNSNNGGSYTYIEYPAPSAPGGYKRGWINKSRY